MTGQDLLDYLRNDILHDKAKPYLWGDHLLLRRLNEAERYFCRETYTLLDDTQTIQTVLNTKTYDMPKGVLFVYSVTDPVSGRDLVNYTRRFLPNGLNTATGDPQIFTMDEASNTIRLFPVPDINSIKLLQLRVARMPLKHFDESTSPEIQSEYHIDLPEFVAGKCFSDSDVDGVDPEAAATHMKEWFARVAKGKHEAYRYRLGASPLALYKATYKVA